MVRGIERRNENPELPRVRVNSDGRYEYFGNTDWHQLTYKDWTQGTDHKLSINGGVTLPVITFQEGISRRTGFTGTTPMT